MRVLLHALHQIFSTMKGSLEVRLYKLKRNVGVLTSMQVSFSHRSLPNSVSGAAKFSVQRRRYTVAV